MKINMHGAPIGHNRKRLQHDLEFASSNPEDCNNHLCLGAQENITGLCSQGGSITATLANHGHLEAHSYGRGWIALSS